MPSNESSHIQASPFGDCNADSWDLQFWLCWIHPAISHFLNASNTPHVAGVSQSGTTASLVGPGHPGPLRTDPESAGDLLNGIVNDCWRGRIPKTDATQRILGALQRLPRFSATTKEKAFSAYLTEIHAVARDDEANPSGLALRTNPSGMALGTLSSLKQGSSQSLDEGKARKKMFLVDSSSTSWNLWSAITNPANNDLPPAPKH